MLAKQPVGAFALPRPHRRTALTAATVMIAAAASSAAMAGNALADAPPAAVMTTINQVADADAAVRLVPSASALASAASAWRWRIHAPRHRARAANDQGQNGNSQGQNSQGQNSQGQDENTLLNSDASAAQYTQSVSGFSWDAANTDVSGATVLSQTSTQMQVQATVTDTFHITGTPNDQAPSDISIASDPYLFTFTQAADRSWQLSTVTRQADTTGTPDTSSPPAGAARAHRRSAHNRRFKHQKPLAASTRIIRHHKSLAHSAATAYNRSAAFNYAWYWWNSRNPAYPSYADDCQNFASQVIHAGGVTRSVWDTWNPGGWEWDNVDGFEWWVNNAGGPLNYLSYVSNLSQGDVLHLHGPNHARHAMVVLSNNGGNPLLAGHTNNRWNYPFSTVYATNPGYSYYAMHVHGTGRG